MYSTLEQKYQRLQKQLTGGIIAQGGIFCTGTLWYWQVEKWSLLDAAYMTVFTLATVGYGELHSRETGANVYHVPDFDGGCGDWFHRQPLYRSADSRIFLWG